MKAGPTMRTIQRWMAVLAMLAVWIGGADAATYYVDSVAGNDNNAGTSISAPWKNLTKIGSRSYQPGDKILLKRGSLWRQTLTVPSSGSTAVPIVIEAYGSGPRPNLRGANLLSGFTQHSGNIWKLSLASSPTQVFFNEVRGAKQTTLSSVNAARKWYWSGGILYVYSAGSPATVYTAPGIEATARDHAVNFNSKSNVIVRGLQLEKTRGNVVFMSNTIANCTLEDCILLQGPPDPSADNAAVLLSSNSVACEVKDCDRREHRLGQRDRRPGLGRLQRDSDQGPRPSRVRQLRLSQRDRERERLRLQHFGNPAGDHGGQGGNL
ncbi:hypothetical protein HS125_04260 [bacterium]|nr:hypothetical protein [bacterium]